MKTLFTMMFMLFIAQANASIEYVEGEDSAPTQQEINKNRACFDELSKAGCGDPGENIKEFRVCLHDAFPSLSDDCKKMMSNLYRRGAK